MRWVQRRFAAPTHRESRWFIEGMAHMTILINLEGPGLAALQKEAAERGVTLDQLADEIIQGHIKARASAGPVVDDASFQEAKTATFRANEELYRRLAK